MDDNFISVYAFKEELADMATVAKFAIVQSEGGRTVTRQIKSFKECI